MTRLDRTGSFWLMQCRSLPPSPLHAFLHAGVFWKAYKALNHCQGKTWIWPRRLWPTMLVGSGSVVWGCVSSPPTGEDPNVTNRVLVCVQYCRIGTDGSGPIPRAGDQRPYGRGLYVVPPGSERCLRSGRGHIADLNIQTAIPRSFSKPSVRLAENLVEFDHHGRDAGNKTKT